MKRQTPEGLIKNQIMEWLSTCSDCMFWPHDSIGIWDPVKKIYRRKNSKFYRKGVSDILGIWKGKPLAIEVKSETGRVTPEQEFFLAQFRGHGGIGIVARSLNDVIDYLREIPKA